MDFNTRAVAWLTNMLKIKTAVKLNGRTNYYMFEISFLRTIKPVDGLRQYLLQEVQEQPAKSGKSGGKGKSDISEDIVTPELDALFLIALLSYVESDIALAITTCTTAPEAWAELKRLYGSVDGDGRIQDGLALKKTITTVVWRSGDFDAHVSKLKYMFAEVRAAGVELSITEQKQFLLESLHPSEKWETIVDGLNARGGGASFEDVVQTCRKKAEVINKEPITGGSGYSAIDFVPRKHCPGCNCRKNKVDNRKRKEEEQYYYKNGLCFKCGKQGHISRDCDEQDNAAAAATSSTEEAFLL